MMTRMAMHKRIALVTGASRGIGQAICLSLLRAGVIVVGTGTTQASTEKISASLQDVASNAWMAIQCDVTSPGACEALVATIEKKLGSITIFVNNAGITRDNLLLRMTENEWAAVLDTNLTPFYKLSKAVLRGMAKARWGRIISISSVVAACGNAGQTNYAAAKAALSGFCRSLAREMGGRNITVNAVAPGFIDTDMTRSLPDSVRTKLLENIPLGRLGMPEEVAAVVAFLVSESASYITGQTLHVNGGIYM